MRRSRCTCGSSGSVTGRRISACLSRSAPPRSSILLFSPAGHMNHWWSIMLQLNLASLLILYAFWRISRQGSHVVAHGACRDRRLARELHVDERADRGGLRRGCRSRHLTPPYVGRRTVFWAVNLVALFTVYLIGVPARGPSEPRGIDLVRVRLSRDRLFDLVNYPVPVEFRVATHIWAPGLVGIGLVAISTRCVSVPGTGCARATRRAAPAGDDPLRRRICAVTGWGRAAFDQTGIAAATQSRT